MALIPSYCRLCVSYISNGILNDESGNIDWYIIWKRSVFPLFCWKLFVNCAQIRHRDVASLTSFNFGLNGPFDTFICHKQAQYSQEKLKASHLEHVTRRTAVVILKLTLAMVCNEFQSFPIGLPINNTIFPYFIASCSWIYMLWSLGYTYNRPIGILHIGFNIVLEGKVKGIPLKDFKELVSVNGEKRRKTRWNKQSSKL